jgi:hypothetical protein
MTHTQKISSPPLSPMPTITPSRSGYTGRRAGDAGPVRVVGRRRKGPSSGFVKTVSPRRHGRKEKRVGRKRQSLSRRPAERRVCLWGTQGEGRSGGLIARCPPGLSPQGGQYRERRWSKARSILPDREAEPTDKNAERGAERCHLLLTYEAAFSAPAD